jgi:hypothetical protein
VRLLVWPVAVRGLDRRWSDGLGTAPHPNRCGSNFDSRPRRFRLEPGPGLRRLGRTVQRRVRCLVESGILDVALASPPPRADCTDNQEQEQQAGTPPPA